MLYYSCCDNRLYTTGYGCGISCVLGINCVPFAAYILYVLYKMLSVFAWLYRGILWLDMQNPAMQLTLVLPSRDTRIQTESRQLDFVHKCLVASLRRAASSHNTI